MLTLAAALSLPSVAFAAMMPITLILIKSDGSRSTTLYALGGTVVVGRTRTASADATHDANSPSDQADLAFAADKVAEPSVPRWLADGDGAKAEIHVTLDKVTLTYVLSDLTSRNMTLTQSPDGVGQASLVLAARHASVNGMPIN